MIKSFSSMMLSILLTGTFFWPSIAWAYLDGGVGSMLLQLLAGGAAGIAVIGKLYFHKIKIYLSRLQSKIKNLK